jgi:Uma2 family endonuclease
MVTAPSAEPPIRAVAFLPSDSDEYLASARMSFEEFLVLDYEGGGAEWVDGEVFLYVSNTRTHLSIVGFLFHLIDLFAQTRGLGLVHSDKYVVRALPGGPGREPDIVFIRRDREEIALETHLAGPPDLVVEVISPDSVRRDQVLKRSEYEAAGVQEYWIIDSREGHAEATFLTLDNGRYRDIPVLNGVLHSKAVEGFWLRPEWLWDRDVRAIDALREVLGPELR